MHFHFDWNSHSRYFFFTIQNTFGKFLFFILPHHVLCVDTCVKCSAIVVKNTEKLKYDVWCSPTTHLKIVFTEIDRYLKQKNPCMEMNWFNKNAAVSFVSFRTVILFTGAWVFFLFRCVLFLCVCAKSKFRMSDSQHLVSRH